MKTIKKHNRYIQFYTPEGLYKVKLVDIIMRIVEYNMQKYNYIKTPKDYKKDCDDLYYDDYLIKDWLLFNSNWKEWTNKATIDTEQKLNENMCWCSSYDFEIIEE